MTNLDKEIAAIMEMDNFYISMVCQASKWLDEKAQGLTGDEEGIKHTYLDRVDCARALIVANDKLQEQAQNYNKLWAHSSELQAQLAERDARISILRQALKWVYRECNAAQPNQESLFFIRGIAEHGLNDDATITKPTEQKQ